MIPQGTAENIRVGVADIGVTKSDTASITTHALGSCIGVTVFDAEAKVGGLLHFMLPKPSSPDQADCKPAAMFGTKGIPLLFRMAYELGARKERIIVCAAGGAGFLNDDAGFQIGKRNRMMMRKLFWKNNIVVAAEETGGSEARTMSIDLSSGTVTIRSKNVEHVLWSL